MEDKKTLTLTLKRKWFIMILSGEKKEEYREIKPYWIKRLEEKSYDSIIFINGYSPNSPRFEIECLGISRSSKSSKWGAVEGEEYFVLKLGKIIDYMYKVELDRTLKPIILNRTSNLVEKYSHLGGKKSVAGHWIKEGVDWLYGLSNKNKKIVAHYYEQMAKTIVYTDFGAETYNLYAPYLPYDDVNIIFLLIKTLFLENNITKIDLKKMLTITNIFIYENKRIDGNIVELKSKLKNEAC